MSMWDLPVPESPMRQSGWLFLIHSQLARVRMVAGSMFGFASKSKDRNDFSRGKPAALILRSERRRARSSSIVATARRSSAAVGQGSGVAGHRRTVPTRWHWAVAGGTTRQRDIGVRVRHVQTASNVYELTWSTDTGPAGRATAGL